MVIVGCKYSGLRPTLRCKDISFHPIFGGITTPAGVCYALLGQMVRSFSGWMPEKWPFSKKS